MLPNHLLWATWITGIALDVVLLGLLAFRKQVQQWPSLVFWCLLDLSADAVLAMVSTNRTHYWFTYWTWFLIAAFARFWILFDVLQSFPGAAFMQKQLRTAVVCTGAAMMAFAWWFASLDGPPAAVRLRTMALAIDSAVLIGWAGFATAFLIVIVASRLRWSKRGLMITLGIAVKACVGLFAADLNRGYKPQRELATELQAFAALTCLLLWVLAFSLSERKPNLAPTA